MYSLLKRYEYTIGKLDSHITITGERADNDINGNAQWMLQVWSSCNTIWHPKVKGYRQRKDNRYKVQGYQIEEVMDLFAETLINHIKNYNI